jgi:hypothetical protein
MNDMTEFSANFVSCIKEWSTNASQCNGNSDCLEECTSHLRECLNRIFPPAKSIDFESDKINYLLSTVFFERTGKVNIEKEENVELYNKFQEQLNEILKKYF